MTVTRAEGGCGAGGHTAAPPHVHQTAKEP